MHMFVAGVTFVKRIDQRAAMTSTGHSLISLKCREIRKIAYSGYFVLRVLCMFECTARWEIVKQTQTEHHLLADYR